MPELEINSPEPPIFAEARMLLTQHGLWEQGWRFALDNAKVRMGACNYTKKRIQFSRNFLHVAPAEITDTLLHEIAHAIAGHRAGHSYLWKSVARSIGASPERCHDEEASAEYNWKMECPSCGRTWLRYRMRQRNFASVCPDCRVRIEIYRLR